MLRGFWLNPHLQALLRIAEKTKQVPFARLCSSVTLLGSASKPLCPCSSLVRPWVCGWCHEKEPRDASNSWIHLLRKLTITLLGGTLPWWNKMITCNGSTPVMKHSKLILATEHSTVCRSIIASLKGGFLASYISRHQRWLPLVGFHGEPSLERLVWKFEG